MKLWGAILLICGGGALGLGLLREGWAHVGLLEQWRAALALIAQELAFRGGEVPVLLEKTAQRSRGAVERTLVAAWEGTKELDRLSFAQVWAQAVEGENAVLTADERESLMSLGAVLGRYDRQSQCRAVEEVRAQLANRAEERRRELRRKGKSYGTIGLTLGCLGAILLF